MIQLSLVRKTLRDYRLLLAGLLALELAFAVLFMFATNSLLMESNLQILQFEFIRQFIKVMVGSDPMEFMTPTAITAFAFTHPMIWMLVITFALTVGSGVLSGEIDRGTMDLLASLPVSRGVIYTSASAALIMCGLPLVWGLWLGLAVGRWVVDAPEVNMWALARLAWHFYAVFVLLASFSLAFSAISRRRSQAIAAAFFVVFYAFVINLLRAMWPALEAVAWSSFLNYYQALLIARESAYRWGDIAVLLIAAGVWWTIGLICFRRRDIHAV